jgi:hypothetical protein
MSDEIRNDEEPEVEAHRRHLENTEPTDEADSDDDVEAHVRRANARMDSPRHI